MLSIKILGPSCANCLKLEVLVMETLTELGFCEATVTKVTIDRELEHYLMGNPPGLVINEQVVWSGGTNLPSKEQIVEWIREVAGVRPA